MFFQNIEKAVFIGAHTDDEMLVAGTLRKLVKMGVNVKVLTFSYALLEKRQEPASGVLHPEFSDSMRLIGLSEGQFQVLDFHPFDLPEKGARIRQRIFDFVEEENPDLAFILSKSDDHPAHAVVGESCQIVMKNRVPNILRCHFPWNFASGLGNLLVALTPDELETKRKVIQAYQSQSFRYDYESIFQTLAHLTSLSTKNDSPVESFEVVRLTVR